MSRIRAREIYRSDAQEGRGSKFIRCISGAYANFAEIGKGLSIADNLSRTVKPFGIQLARVTFISVSRGVRFVL